MTQRPTNPAWTLTAILLALVLSPRCHAQSVLVDQVIAVVNGDLILESDIDEERRFEAFQPIAQAEGPSSRAAIIERLIDRALILQQARLQPDDKVTLQQAQANLNALRTEIPACKQFHCETDPGWQKFVESEGFTVPQLEELWRQRMETLKFVELRFRAGIRVTPAEVKTYYDDTLVPQLARRNTPPPALDTVSDRIQEILLQQRVGSLLTDWLTSLKAQGTVRIMKPGEEAP
jgi:parvulin-like peptidyl-prolyl isomerase